MAYTFSWQALPRPFAALSPMVGVTDSAFRQICKGYGADVLFTEMVSSEALMRSRRINLRTARMLEFREVDQPVICQLMGADPEIMARAAAAAEEAGFAGVDINMGCPEKSINGNGCGSSLLNTPDLAVRIVKAVLGAISIPLSVKMRAGVTGSVQPDFALRMEEAGVAALTVHPRTKVQGYKGEADWDITRQVADAVSVPVMGSGDITGWSRAKTYIAQAGLAGVFIARGSMGNPWIFLKDARPAYLDGTNDANGDYLPTLAEILDVAWRHADLMYESKGQHGIIEMRKHLSWYMRGFVGAPEVRAGLVRVETLDQIRDIITQVREANGISRRELALAA